MDDRGQQVWGREGASFHGRGENMIVDYTQGLRNISNNLTNAYSLWCGLSIAKGKDVRSLLVFGDSTLVIKAMIGHYNHDGDKLKILLSRIKSDLSPFERISLFYIKQELNEEANHWSNFTFELSIGTIIKSGVMNFRLIP